MGEELLSIPTKEPESFRAGTTVKWTKSFTGYPASTWTLTYTFVQKGVSKTQTADASGDDHSVTISHTDSTGYVEGTWNYVGTVTDGSETYEVTSGEVEVLPNLASVSKGYDPRSEAVQWRDALLEARQIFIDNPRNLNFTNVSAGARSKDFRSFEELQVALDRANHEVERERRAQGLSKSHKVMVRL